ncbi:uncharacterized protein LOC128492006 [Spea bombifrons]|uniref:uncharacterized protein LOC128492006 n=1 Tax=Spea bombifrons TaxID=233779 RepID=UPI00234A7EE4|nr:uncharacterized protein LOC128492006 [Spea bombifrons]
MGLPPAAWKNEELSYKRFGSSPTEMSTDIGLRQNWLLANQVLYPTPPYASLRENIAKVFIVPVRKRRFLDMIKKFDLNDLSYVYFSTSDNEHEFIGTNTPTPIMDIFQKSCVVENGTLWAKSLQGQNVNLKAKFIIGIGNLAQGEKTPVSLNIYNTNLYLSYQSGKLQVQPETQNAINYTSPDAQKFFFFVTQTGSVTYSFEPVTAPNWFLSTSSQGNSPVTVQPLSANSYNKEFKFDPGYFIPGVSGSVSRFDRPLQEQETFGDVDQYVLNGSKEMFSPYTLSLRPAGDVANRSYFLQNENFPKKQLRNSRGIQYRTTYSISRVANWNQPCGSPRHPVARYELFPHQF